MDATRIVRKLAKEGLTVAIAESCTGGLVAHHLTNVPGSSAVFKEGIVAYSNESKIRRLAVSEESLRRFGAVSAEVAKEMAEGVRVMNEASFGLATTGIAGPDGGSSETPVGTVYLAIAEEGKETEVWKEYFPQGRLSFKEAAAVSLLERFLVKLL